MAVFPPVLIVAGGLGTRIKSICPDLPKSLVPVNGEPFVAHQLRILRRENVRDVIFCVAHLSQPLVDFVGDGSRFGLPVRYSYDSDDGDQLLGTGGAVLKASRLVASPFAVMYGDSYLDVPFAPVYDAFLQADKLALMTVYRNENKLIPSNLLVEDGLVVAYNKEQLLATMAHADFGLSIFMKSAFDGFGAQPFDLTQVVQRLIAQRELAALEMEQRFYEAGGPQGVRDLEQYLGKAMQKSSSDDCD